MHRGPRETSKSVQQQVNSVSNDPRLLSLLLHAPSTKHGLHKPHAKKKTSHPEKEVRQQVLNGEADNILGFLGPFEGVHVDAHVCQALCEFSIKFLWPKAVRDFPGELLLLFRHQVQQAWDSVVGLDVESELVLVASQRTRPGRTKRLPKRGDREKRLQQSKQDGYCGSFLHGSFSKGRIQSGMFF